MKETKKFFDTNHLNKGYTKVSTHKQAPSNNSGQGHQYKHILPPMDIIAEYEELSPGILEKIVAIAQKEQNHRHSMDTLNNEKHNKASDMGRKSALILVAIIALAVVILAFGEHYMVASILAVSAFGSIGVISSSYKKPVNKFFHKNFDPKYKNPNYKPRYKEKY